MSYGCPCPKCGAAESAVIDSRPIEDAVRRRRACGGCGARWTTVERNIEADRHDELMVRIGIDVPCSVAEALKAAGKVSAGNIREDHLAGLNSTGQRFASMPLYTAGGGMGRRQCTREYKIEPITKKLRELIDAPTDRRGRQRVPKGVLVEQWHGISRDEIVRCKENRAPWIVTRWPLIELDMTRRHCLEWWARQYPGRLLRKSACVCCPYHDNAAWRDLSDEEFEEACAFDDAIRENGSTLKGMREQQFLHASLKPLREVDLRTDEDRGQMNLLDECDGMCGT